MNYQDYKLQVSMAYSDKTIQNRKSQLRLFDVWLRGLRGDLDNAEYAVKAYKGMDRQGRRSYKFSDYDPKQFDEISDFILFLWNELDYSRTMCRHYFDAIQSYCDKLGLGVYDKEQFLAFRQDYVDDSYDPLYDETTIFTIQEVEQLISELESPASEFVCIQYLHCRRPGEVKELQVDDINLAADRVVYSIKKQQFDDENKRRPVYFQSDREREYFSKLVHTVEDKLLFPSAQSDLEAVRRPFRNIRDDLDIAEIPLKNLRHTRISHFRAAGWEYEDIRDQYTHHKHLATLQDKYLRSVDENFENDDLWKFLCHGCRR